MMAAPWRPSSQTLHRAHDGVLLLVLALVLLLLPGRGDHDAGP
ncbi:MAG: hypothetical protein PSX79_09460 [bacterium]|nr:hypothetical protein [bacterium]